jgi:hypothetical protein
MNIIVESQQQLSISRFDHKFEGWSVWLEPDPKQVDEMIQEMKHLSIQCGGIDQGTYTFDLHCTLLYNFNPCHMIRRSPKGEDISGQHYEENNGEFYRKIGTQMLKKCIDKYVDILEKRDENCTISESNSPCNSKERIIELNPSDFYFFHYPKEADDGRGFGCVISMLLLENNINLQDLQQVVSDIFPPDERHGNNTNTKDIPPNDNNRQCQKKPFIPHMALVYAPEIYHDYLKHFTDSQLKNTKAHWLRKPIQAKYLSLWCTKGTLKDWKLIARVDLEEELSTKLISCR